MVDRSQATPSETGARMRIGAYLELARPANVVTAPADVLAGIAAAGLLAQGWGGVEANEWFSVILLCMSTAALYAGGVAFNDVFDAAIDAEERPERPIPSGRITRQEAAIWGGSLLLVGVSLAAFVSVISAAIAIAIGSLAVIYDAYGKHHTWVGPINMGLCRGLNLLLGVSIVPVMLISWWFLAIIPIVYIAAITAISQGEVHGGASLTGWTACGMVVLVLCALVGLGIFPAYYMFIASPFALLLAILVMPAFVQAARRPQPQHIRLAVKSGVMALIVLNATLAAGFAGWVFGLLVLALLPISYGLSRLFAVT